MSKSPRNLTFERFRNLSDCLDVARESYYEGDDEESLDRLQELVQMAMEQAERIEREANDD